jgi:general secretion pathway protein F
MAIFRYKALSASGETITGELEARDRSAAVATLQSLGHLPIQAEETAPASSPGSGTLLPLLTRRRLRRQDLVMLTRDLATMLRSGLSLDRTLEILIEVAERQPVRDLLARVWARIRDGASLSDAMAAQGETFPRFYVSMVRAGEAGGALETVLARLADYLENTEAVRQRVNASLRYPLILLLMTGLSMVVLFTFVLPEFEPLFEDAGEALPLLTQIVMGIGEAFRSYGGFGLAALLLGLLVLRSRLKQPAFRQRWDGWLLALPLFGPLLTRIEVARLARTLGSLLNNGVPLLQALGLTRETVGNRVIGDALERVAVAAKEGQGLATPLAETERFPPLAAQLIRVGEETGRLDEMLMRAADIYDAEVERTVQKLLALLVPVVTLGLGAVIALIIGSVVVAIFSVNQLAF